MYTPNGCSLANSFNEIGKVFLLLHDNFLINFLCAPAFARLHKKVINGRALLHSRNSS